MWLIVQHRRSPGMEESSNESKDIRNFKKIIVKVSKKNRRMNLKLRK
jgi:hypothetical protein